MNSSLVLHDCGLDVPVLWHGGEAPDRLTAEQEQKKWHVLHVRSRQEKALSDDLAAMRIAHYLPLVSRMKHHGSRRVTVEMPLFPGYLFLRGTLEEAYGADRTKRVAHILYVSDQKQMEWELRNLRLALSKEAALDPYPYFKKGVRVEVRSGPFRGLQGVIEDRLKTDRLVLCVEMLGRAASLEIDGALLEPLE
jgi:transcription antitermination factor NusG